MPHPRKDSGKVLPFRSFRSVWCVPKAGVDLLGVVLLWKPGDGNGLWEKFLFLGIPAFLCIAAVILAKIKFPDPEKFEPEVKETKEAHLGFRFKIYMVGTALFAFGFIDFPIVALHAVKSGLAGEAEISLLCMRQLWRRMRFPLCFSAGFMISTVPYLSHGLHCCRCLLCFYLYGTVFLLAVCRRSPLGNRYGAQESTLKAAVAAIVPKRERAVGYGIFETGFGVSWFIGSFLLGILYDASILWMAAISALMQAAAVPFSFVRAGKRGYPMKNAFEGKIKEAVFVRQTMDI